MIQQKNHQELVLPECQRPVIDVVGTRKSKISPISYYLISILTQRIPMVSSPPSKIPTDDLDLDNMQIDTLLFNDLFI